MLKAPIIASRTTHIDSPALADTREEAEVHVVRIAYRSCPSMSCHLYVLRTLPMVKNS